MILTLYRNYNTGDPIKFEGRSKEGLLYKLQKWLDGANGDVDQNTKRHKPVWADGLAIAPSGRGAVVLLKNGSKWEVWKGTLRSKPLVSTSWIVARAVFLHYAHAHCREKESA